LLAEPWTPQNGLLTPTLKLRRGELGKRFEKEMEEIFKAK
jgi:long-subunit acyl-CoA synthetase (AMP-forming)